MKKYLPLIVGIVILILLIVIYVVLVKQDEKGLEESEETTRVMDITDGDIVSICLNLSGNEETFTKVDDTWTLVSDKEFEVNNTKLDNLLSSLVDMSAGRVLENVSDYAQYGLESPSMDIVLITGSGKEYTICFGDLNDVTGEQYVYVKEQGSNVYMVEGSTSSSISQVLEDYRTTETDTEEQVTEK